MSLNIEVHERRLRMLRYHVQGVRPSIWVRDIAREYGVHERTVWRDWARRDEWLPFITSLGDENSDSVVADLLVALGEARALLFRAYHNADNSSARVGALREIVDSIDREFRIRQSLGQIRMVQPPLVEVNLSQVQARLEVEERWQSMTPEERDELEEYARALHRRLTGSPDGR